jgi:hypothetical protein
MSIFIATLDYLLIMSLFGINYSLRNVSHSSFHCLYETAESCEFSDCFYNAEKKAGAVLPP